MRILTIAAIVCVLTASCTAIRKPLQKTNQFGNVQYLNEQQLRDYLSFIASDELEGRDTPSRGLNIAAEFIATNLSRWGYVPAGDSGSYFQKIALLKNRIIPSQTYVTIQGKKFVYGEDCIASAVKGELRAPLVYVNHGYIIPSKKINDYKDIDVNGKIMVVAGGYPKGITRADVRGQKDGVEYTSPTKHAAKNGALAIIVIPTINAIMQWEKNQKYEIESGRLNVLKFQTSENQPIPTVTLSAQAVNALFKDENTGVQSMNDPASADSVAPFYFSSAKYVSLHVATIAETVYTQNVVGILEGADEKFKKEYVAFGAHYDHVGIGTPVRGDSIYNGADDDGTGTSALLAMAEAYLKGERPKRSLLFVWHTGEEKGLWGSEYFVKYPAVPLENITVQLNIDMIGRSKPDSGNGSENINVTGRNEIFVIGSKKMSTELGALSETVNASLLNIQFNYKFDEPNDPERLFYRSDHYNYAQHNIPIIFYFDGLHEDYHKVTDEVSTIDFAKFLNVTKTIYATGWVLAHMPHRLTLDKTAEYETEK